MTEFWHKHPALWYGLLVLLTALYFFCNSPLLLFPFFGLLIPFVFTRNYLKLIAGLGLSVAFFGWLSSTITLPPADFESTHGKALFQVDTIQQTSSSFGEYSKIRGTLLQFVPQNSNDNLRTIKQIPASLVISKAQSTHLTPGFTYALNGTLSRTLNGYRFKGDLHGQLQIIRQPWIPLAEWRRQAKVGLRQRISSAIPDQRSAHFIAGLATGEFDDRMTQHQLSRFGLQHLLAISGFHFALLASFLLVILSLVFKGHTKEYLLLILLTLYALYLGNSPSVIRAWIMLSIAIAAPLIGRQSLALNSLGIALLVLIGFDPHSVNNLGFQFSCAITASILMFNAPIDKLLETIYPTRNLEQAIQLNWVEQHGLIILANFRKLLALSLAVNVIALPLCLAYFHKFPWMGLPYNLFFPLLTAPVLFFLLLGLMLDCVSLFCGGLVHQFNGVYTHLLLNLTYNMPEAVDSVWMTNSLSPVGLGILLTLIFSVGIYHLAKQKQDALEIRSPYLYLG